MESLARRGFLKALLGVGAAAALGLKASETLAGPADAAEAATGANTAAEATETTEAGLETNQFYIVRRRRFYRRRRVFYFRPRRRRIIYYRPRRRFYRVRRFRRW